TVRDFGGPLPAGPVGPPGPAGPAGALGLQWVGGESGYDSNSPKTATVSCPAGKRAISWSWHIELSSTQSPQTAPGLTGMTPLDGDVATGRMPGGYTGKAQEGGTYNDGWKLFVYAACVTV
ncbi:MAG TPA: hypothetical protein VFV62_03830, partial [Gaiellaceae bacterium]|nr:hypothetical protein [Gaiellaceae bacterium]